MVRQHDHSKWPENDPLAVGVLTWVPAPRGEFDPVQNFAAMRLATLTVKLRDELAADVDGIVAKHTGSTKCPVRIADDGSLLFVFRLSESFETVQTHPTHDPDRATAESGPSWIPLNGTWRDDLDLLDVRRSDLPEMNKAVADALVRELDALLSDCAPRWEPPVYVKRPLLLPGERLVWSNTRALGRLRENGFQTLLPVRWGSVSAERDGFSDANGFWHYNCDVSSHGVGVTLKGLVAISQPVGRFREDVDAAVKSIGPCLIRTAEGTHVYVFRTLQGGIDEDIQTPWVHLSAYRKGLIVLAGANENGFDYSWSHDLLQTRVESLGIFEQHDVYALRKALEQLPPPDYGKPAVKRARRA
jgi:hypothetical protein